MPRFVLWLWRKHAAGSRLAEKEHEIEDLQACETKSQELHGKEHQHAGDKDAAPDLGGQKDRFAI
jgi:hypothetical protein